MINQISLYQQRLNLEDATFQRIEHKDASTAIAYKITQPSGMQFILKICSRPQEFERERYFLNYFKNKLPVPNIMQVIEPEAVIQGAILMECFPGAPLNINNVTEELAYEIGSLFARIHLNRTGGYGDPTQPQTLQSDPRDYFAQQFETYFAECNNHLPQELLDACRNYYDAHLNLLTKVDGPCMVHRDFRPGNIMVHQGKIQGIIDWATSRTSFSEEDFRAIEHCWQWPNLNTKELFFKGYASIRPVPEYQAIMLLLRLTRALDVLGFTLKRGTWQSSLAYLYQSERKFLNSFF